ncbi:hypothetical protein [Gaoshiqia sp. Z1-71]|uniref:hypothetical protein n=1 Tax=Gaoshiqia hydrogeniformans TaxID=3290090 RepID=UPI003BF805BF
MRKVFFVLLLILPGVQGLTQTGIVYDFRLYDSPGIMNSLKRLNTEVSYDQMGGSPFLNNEFVSGEIFLTDSTSYKNVPLRYNIYTDNMEFRDKSNQILEVGDPRKFDRFELNGAVFRYLPYNSGSRTESGYLLELTPGKATLYKKIKISLRNAVPPQAYKDAEPPTFVSVPPEYYLALTGHETEKVKSNKHLTELLKPIQPDIDDYIKNEKLKLNKEEDLIRAVSYCNR